MRYLYKISNTINDKVYIGITLNPKGRFLNHKNPNSSCTKLREAMVELGADNFNMELLCLGMLEDMEELEIKAINLFDSIDNGYNTHTGGFGGATPFRFNLKDKHLLGTMTDTDLSKIVNIPAEILSHYREMFNIPIYTPMKDVDINLIGTMTDVELANMYGVENSTISYLRRELGIPPFERDEVYQLIRDNSHLLKEDTNRGIAKTLGVSYASVAKVRKELGIQCVPTYKKYKITPELLVKYRNDELAVMFDLKSGTVGCIRRELGIESHPPKGTIHIPEEELGTMLDKHLAVKYNCNHGMITKRRNKLGIPRFIE